jgi:hypothetical protein
MLHWTMIAGNDDKTKIMNRMHDHKNVWYKQRWRNFCLQYLLIRQFFQIFFQQSPLKGLSSEN